MSIRKSRIILTLMTAVLGVAVVVVIYGQFRPRQRTFHKTLANYLPQATSDWQCTTLAIATTPEMQKAVDEMLNFDDAIYCNYTKGHLRLSVYVAYWSEGSMPPRLISGHTPDACWPGAGWQCITRGNITYQSPASAFPVPPGQSRVFVANGNKEYVWFWHVVDGRSIPCGAGTEPPWYGIFSDLLRNGFDQRSEQFFIRLSSPQPLDDPALAGALHPILQLLPMHLSW